VHENNGDLGRRRLRGPHRLSLEGDDQIDPLSHERSGRHASGVLVGLIPPVEADVLVLVSETLQAFAKGRQRGWLMVEADVEEPNPPDLPRRRLRLGGERLQE